jgi:hypothetical protein
MRIAARSGREAGRRRWRLRLALAPGVVAVAIAAAGPAATSARAAVGARLDAFVPSPARDGRALAISGSTAYVSSQDEGINKVDLAAHAAAGTIETLGSVPHGFGALAFDPSGALWGAEYFYGTGQIYRIDFGASTIEGVFDAYGIDAANESIDGLAIDSDATLWLSGEGEGAVSTTVYHVAVSGAPGSYAYSVLGEFTVPFGNSGIAVDGEHLWLADIDGRRIVEYDKSGAASGVSFPTGEFNGSPVEPEGLALDHCTFPGKLALWTYGANSVAGPLAAYEVGTTSDTSGCPPPQEESSGGSGSSPKLSAGGPGGGGATAGASTLLVAADPADPTGTVFVYLWRFGDGHRLRGHGRVWHRYSCAGLYRVTVTEVDSRGARHVSRGTLSVGFPRRATRRYRGLRFSPHVRVAGRRAKLWLSWRGRGHGVRARSVDWALDRQRGRRFPIHTRVVARVRRGRNHRLRARVHFSNRRAVTIRACFHA